MDPWKQLAHRAMSRRAWLRGSAASGIVLGSSRFPRLARALSGDGGRKRHCILLWMAGGASQLDTFDMKPQHANGGEFKEIQTSVPGLRFCEHLPNLARQAEQLAIVRGVSTKEGDHGRGTYLMRTGRKPGGPVAFPTIGSALSKELGDQAAELPDFVAISPYQAFNPAAFSPGFLGPRYAPVTVGAVNEFQPTAPEQQAGYAELGLDNVRLPEHLTEREIQQRLKIWNALQDRFLAGRNAGAPQGHDTVYRRAIRMIQSQAVDAFDLTSEPDAVRQAYGRGRFGQGCLMARRLVEQGVPFVEVTLGFEPGSVGWDTHQNNFPAVRQLSAQLDQGWSTLMRELAERDLLESTTILWMGEFGRTPAINSNAGRDHFPAAWTCVFAGGGVRGGQVHGRTSPDGQTVEDGKVSEGDLLATLCAAAGVDPGHENISPLGRPFKIAEGSPIREVLA